MRFRWVKAPRSDEITQLAHTMARRIGRFLERQGLLERDAKKLERLCRYITRPAVSEKRLSLTPNGNVRYPLKTP